MKMKIFKRNQIIISVIALMLITVGYMNYTSNISTTLETGALMDAEQVAGIGDAKLVNSNNIVENSEDASETQATESSISDVNGEDYEIQETSGNSYGTEYFISSRLERDKMYSQMIETYKAMLESSTVSAEQKSISTKEITNINDNLIFFIYSLLINFIIN
jgi:hypothetical protein